MKSAMAGAANRRNNMTFEINTLMAEKRRRKKHQKTL